MEPMAIETSCTHIATLLPSRLLQLMLTVANIDSVCKDNLKYICQKKRRSQWLAIVCPPNGMDAIYGRKYRLNLMLSSEHVLPIILFVLLSSKTDFKYSCITGHTIPVNNLQSNWICISPVHAKYMQAQFRIYLPGHQMILINICLIQIQLNIYIEINESMRLYIQKSMSTECIQIYMFNENHTMHNAN